MIVYKGAPNLHLDKLSGSTQALAIVMTSLVVAVLSLLFWLPYVYSKVVRKDYSKYALRIVLYLLSASDPLVSFLLWTPAVEAGRSSN